MIKVLRLAFLIPLLVSCGPINKDKSSVEESKSAIKTGIEDIDAFISSVSALKDHPNKASVKMTTVNNYMYSSGDDYMTITITDIFDIERFTLDGEDGITVREGIYTIEDDESKYVSQLYHDDENLYLLVNYTSPLDQDTKRTATYTKEALEENLSINFSYKEFLNLQYLAECKDLETIFAEYSLPEEIPTNGEVKYKYSLTAYQDGYLNQKISHDVSFTIEDGVITSSKQIVENDLFGGTRQKVNYSITTTEVTYEQGEYKEFDGTLFNPDKFNELES